MIKNYKVRLEPNNKQHSRMLQFAGAARYAYNWALEQQNKCYKDSGKFLSDCDLRKQFTQYKQTNTWLYDISNEVTKQAIKDAVIAFSNFFKGRAGYPRFKTKKKSKPSFYQDTFKFKATETHIRVEKISTKTAYNKKKLNWIKLSEKGRIPTDASYLNSRITFDGIHWYISVGVEHLDDIIPIPTNPGIGIDLGIKELAVCSDKVTYSNINKTDRVKRLEKAKHRKQRQISRKYEKNKQGNKYVKTKNIVKAELALLKLNHKLTNIRNDYIHKVTMDIVKREPSFIVLEDLNVKGMLKNKHLSKSVQQQNFYRFRGILEYKAENAGIKLTIADRFYPSSKLCSNCGAIKHDLEIKDRVFKCNECGLKIDRDYNASLNLCRLGCSTAMLVGINVCGVLHKTEVVSTKQDTKKQKLNRSLKAS